MPALIGHLWATKPKSFGICSFLCLGLSDRDDVGPWQRGSFWATGKPGVGLLGLRPLGLLAQAIGSWLGES
jgi:hypothetical protein